MREGEVGEVGKTRGNWGGVTREMEDERVGEVMINQGRKRRGSRRSDVNKKRRSRGNEGSWRKGGEVGVSRGH